MCATAQPGMLGFPVPLESKLWPLCAQRKGGVALCGNQSAKREGKVLDFLPAMAADTAGLCPWNEQLKNTYKPRSADTVTVNQHELV